MGGAIKLFESKNVRAQWDAERGDWLWSVVDICGALTSQPTARGATLYWGKLKQRLKAEGSELLTICQHVKLQSGDGKFYETDVLDTKGVLRLIQSIPSPKAEPFKMWLASVGAERLDTIADPEKAIRLAGELYKAKGYTDGWIKQRLQTIEMRNKLEDEWQERGATTSKDYAILTNEMLKAWSGMTVAEVTTTTISKNEKPETMAHNTLIAIRGGKVANTAKIEYEKASGQKAVSPINATHKELLETNKKGGNKK